MSKQNLEQQLILSAGLKGKKSKTTPQKTLVVKSKLVSTTNADGTIVTRPLLVDEQLPRNPFKEDPERLAITRVRLMYLTSLSTNVAGNIVNAQFSTGQIFSLPALGWSSYAARFLQYRCVGMRYRLFPHYNTSFDSTLTSTLGTIAVAPYYNGAPPASLNNIVLGPDVRFLSTAKQLTIDNIPVGFLNAGLWQDTSTGIPLNNQYGFSLYGFNSVALAANQIIFDAVIEWMVEFRDPQ
jgi:hypothetical protein